MGCELSCLAQEAWERLQWELAVHLHLELLRRHLVESSYQISALAVDNHQLLQRTSYLATLFGRTEEADLLLAGFAELCRKQGLSLNADRVDLQRVQLALGSGRLAEAYELLDAMRPTLGDVFDGATLETTPTGMTRWEFGRRWTGGGDRRAFFAHFYLDMGRLAEYQGDFGLAATTLEQGLRHAREEFSTDAGRFASPLHLSLAETLIERGDLRSAGGELALVHLKIDDIREPGHAVREKELWAAIHMLAGEFGACLDQLREVVTVLQGQGPLRAALRAQLNLAQAQIFLLQTAEAQHSLAYVIGQARLIRDTDLERRAGQLVLLADWRLRRCASEPLTSVRLMQRDPSAPAQENRVSPPCPPAPSGSFLARLDERVLAFRTLLELGEVKSAERDWREIRKGFGFTDSALIQARLVTLEAELLAFQDKYERARALVWQVLPTLRALGLKPELSLALSQAADYAEKAGCPGSGAALIEESHDLADEMAQTLPTPERLMFLLGRSAQEENWLRGKLDRLGSSYSGSTGDALWPEVSYVLSRIEGSKELLFKEALGQHLGAPSSPLLPYSCECPANRAVVVFAVLSDRVLVVWYTSGLFGFRIEKISRRQVRELVAQWHVSLKDSSDGFAASVQAGRTLAASLGLFEVLDELPGEVTELIFMPDDSLNGFPFAALRDAKGYLIERYAISVAHLKPRPPVVAPPVTRPLLAAVMYGTRKYQVLSAVNELEWLAEQFPGSHQVAAEEMNRQTLLQSLPNADLLHMVCHGEFSCDHPEETGLVLVPRTGRTELLSLIDIAGLTLPTLRHATLVACWGADNYVLPGRWVLGLAGALCWSGADSVLASLWVTHSLIADRFVKAFYLHLRATSRGEALRRTQLEFLKRGAHLFEWSGWQLYGETGPLHF